MAQGLRLEHRTALLPRAALVQFMSLLPLPADSMAEVIARAIEDNPLLVRAPGGPCLGCGRHCRRAYCQDCRISPLPGQLAAAVDWREELAAAARLELPAAARPLVELVVGSLDDRGLLPRLPAPLGAVAASHLDAVLEALRRVGPPGIAARSPLDCVRLQVERLAAVGACPPLLLRIVPDHLGAVADHDLDAIAAALATPTDEVGRAVAFLVSRIRPYPTLEGPLQRPATPDLVFRDNPSRPAGALDVEVVTDAAWFGLEVDQGLWLQRDREARRWLAVHRHDATALLTALAARASMLRRIATVLADVQRGYLRHGDTDHRPLSRSALARTLDVHPSTVGRAVHGKWARCPDGRVVSLVGCFGGNRAVIASVQAALAAHPAASDAELSRVLRAQGRVVARRTVAKYRAGLEGSTGRRSDLRPPSPPVPG